MQYKGRVLKMKAEFAEPIKYTLPIGEDLVDMNALIGQYMIVEFLNQINCTRCGSITKTSFMGFCYSCFTTAPEAAECIINPEKCRAHEGEGRDVEWEKANHLQPHVVYLALSSGVKVGVTREVQIPTRWIDQGASEAIKLAEVPNRYLAGMIEVELKQHMSDKTNWQRMLKNEIADEDLLEHKEIAYDLMGEYQDYLSDDDDITYLEYPVEEYPFKVKSINFDKIDEVEGYLKGIKGQYLIFDNGRVMNVRKHAGYNLAITIE